LLQIVMDWAKRVAYEQGNWHWIASATVLTFGSYALGVRRMPNLSTIS
jgi:poly(A) polymerase